MNMNRLVISNRIVTTRQPHKCYGCGRGFAKGTIMDSKVVKFNGIVSRKYFCESCHHEMITKNITVDKFWYGELLRDALRYEKSKKHRRL